MKDFHTKFVIKYEEPEEEDPYEEDEEDPYNQPEEDDANGFPRKNLSFGKDGPYAFIDLLAEPSEKTYRLEKTCRMSTSAGDGCEGKHFAYYSN